MVDALVGSKKWVIETILDCPVQMSDAEVIERIVRLAGGSMEQSEVREAVLRHRATGPYGYWKSSNSNPKNAE